MGNVCMYKEDVNTLVKNQTERGKEVIEVKGHRSSNQIRFQVTTDKLIHISADLLVLFMDNTTNIKRNDHFLKLPVQGVKLQQHLVSFLQRHKLSSDKYITFNIIIPTLNFGKVSVVFCQTWREDAHNHAQFKQTLKSYFDSIHKQGYKNIAITEFTSQLGVHLQKGFKGIMQEIIRLQDKPEVIQFCCLSQESKDVLIQTVNSNREDIANSIGTTQSNAESDYF